MSLLCPEHARWHAPPALVLAMPTTPTLSSGKVKCTPQLKPTAAEMGCSWRSSAGHIGARRFFLARRFLIKKRSGVF